MKRPFVRHAVGAGMLWAFAAASLGSIGCAPPSEDKSGIEVSRRNFVYDNGIAINNGMKIGNGYQLKNGLQVKNGINFSNGVSFSNGVQLFNGADLDGWSVPNFNADVDEDLHTFIQDDPQMNERVLKYLVECAMPYGQEVALKMDGSAYTLGYGKAGLGSSVMYGDMSQGEQEAVSACIMARVNAKGEIVQINEFGPFSGFDSSNSDEMAQFPVGEYTFYGNLFSDPPEAYMTYGGATWRSECTTRACQRPDGSCDCGVLQNIPSASCTKNTIGGTSSSYYTDCYGGGRSWHNAVSARVARKGSGETCSLNYQCASRSCSVNDGASWGNCN